MSIIQNFLNLKNSIPSDVKLVAVSKFKPEALIRELYDGTAHLAFGENRAREMATKHELLPQELEWHFIGHLQTNKVRLIVPFVKLIQSVDSLKLLAEINKESLSCGRITDVLLQFHIATEETKFGLSIGETHELLSSEAYKSMNHVRICGLMGMASFSDEQSLVRKEFNSLRMYFEELKRTYFSGSAAFKEISMGMSGDYRIAIDEGSSIVRIGSLIFGKR